MSLTIKQPPVKVSVDEGPTQLRMSWMQWFSDLYYTIKTLIGTSGAANLSSVFASFSNSATQTFVAANTPTVVALNTTDGSNGVTLTSNRVYVSAKGKYNYQFSLQMENTNTTAENVWVWLRKNGVDVPWSASTWDVPSKHGSSNGYVVAAINFFVTADTAGDYFELVAAVSNTTVSIEAYPASTTPFTRPSIPSSIVTINFVST